MIAMDACRWPLRKKKPAAARGGLATSGRQNRHWISV